MEVIRTTTFVKWKEIEGYPGYFISNNGLVRKGKDLQKIRILKKSKNYAMAYVSFYFYCNGKQSLHRKNIHLLVWENFGSGIPLMGKYEIHHTDFNPLNNHINNLKLLQFENHKLQHKNKSING